MKSRLLSTAAALFLLLGLVSTSAFAQISSSASVDFYIRSYNSASTPALANAWHNTTATTDTVGRKMEAIAQWTTSSQLLSSVSYTVTFPKGTVMESTVADSIYLRFYGGSFTGVLASGNPTEIKVASANIAVDGNPIASYSGTKSPKITVTDQTVLNNPTTVQIVVYSGLNIGKLKANVNSSAQDYMKWALNVSSQASTTFEDSSSLQALNDLVAGVEWNSAIGGYIDSVSAFASSDTVIFVDRFGNYVPNWPSNAVTDSIIISVAAGSGVFILDSVNNAIGTASDGTNTPDPLTNGDIYFQTAGDSTKIIVKHNGGAYLNTTAAYTSDDLFHQLSGGSSSTLLLGMRSPAGVTVGGLGLIFNGTNSQDSTTFTIAVGGANTSKNTVLGVAAGNSSSVKRARLSSAASKQIGQIDLTWTTGGITYVGGRLNGTLAISLKNIFGENFSGTPVVGTGTDPISYKFFYLDSMTVDETKTAQLASGKTVSSVYSMPATTLNYTNMGTDAFGASTFTGTLASSAYTVSAGNDNLPIYYGMASHATANADSIGVVFYATNDPTKVDTFKIRVEPGTPVAFDLDTLKANLAAATLTKNAALAANLPLIALDTAYNRVSNLAMIGATTYLDGISLPSSGAIGAIKAINFLIDGRDPAGYNTYNHATGLASRDSIFFSYLGTRPALNADPITNRDTSFIADLAFGRTDSSKINIGGIGADSLGMRLRYVGQNYVISAKWDPAQIGTGWTPAARTIDIGLFSLSDTTAVDSAQSLTLVSTNHMAGRVDTLTLSFVLPQGNTVGPNNADSLIFIKFSNMAGAAGLPVGLDTSKVKVSLDGTNYYSALGLSAITSEDQDSVWIASPVTLNTTSSAKTGYIRFLNFRNPTKANVDSAGMYPASIKTEATPVLHTKTSFFDGEVVADSAAKLFVATVQDTLKITRPRRLDWDVVNLTSALSVTAGDSTLVKILQVDQYDNVLNDVGTNVVGTTAFAIAGTRKLVFKSVDSTSTGQDMVVSQKYANTVYTGSGTNMYDTLTVRIDGTTGGGATGNPIYADSVWIKPYNSNSATAYYIVVSDTTMLVRDSVLVNIMGGAVASLTIDPDTLVTAERSDTLPMLSVTAKDSYGNPVAAASVTIARSYGADGAFVDTNGVAVASGVDTLTIKTAANGVATAKFRAGATGDSVKLSVSATGATTKTFRFKLQIADLNTTFAVTSPADTLEPSLSVAGTIVGTISDGNTVAEVWVNVWRSELVQNSGMTFDESEATEIMKAASATGSSDQVSFSLAIGDTADVDTAVVIRYQLVGRDATNDTTWSDTMMYVVAPNRGKRNMTADAVNVADVMRLVYLIAIDEIVPTVVDYLGLDLDVDGTFDTPDLLAELAIWKGTGTLLAGAGISEGATAKAELSYEATDKATANLAINLDASDNMNVAIFRIKYDTKKFTFGEAKATERLQGVSVVSDANEQDGIYTIVLINTEGGQIVKGSGAILNIQVSAVGEKFDGVGEISLLNASFDEGVAAEISREVLSPKALLPKAFALSQNYPNPFNPSTTIAYDIPEGDNVQVQLNVYNMRGQLVRTLVDEVKSEGSYQIQWDGSDNYGRKVASGVYFYRIKAGEFSKTRKMVILK